MVYISKEQAEEIYSGLANELKEALDKIEKGRLLYENSNEKFRELENKGYITKKLISGVLLKKIKKAYGLFNEYIKKCSNFSGFLHNLSKSEFGQSSGTVEYLVRQFLFEKDWNTKKIFSEIKEGGRTLDMPFPEFKRRIEKIKKQLIQSEEYKEFKAIRKKLIKAIGDLPRKLKEETVNVQVEIRKEQSDNVKAIIDSVNYSKWLVVIALVSSLIIGPLLTIWATNESTLTQIHYEKPRIAVYERFLCNGLTTLNSDDNCFFSANTKFSLINVGRSTDKAEYQIISDEIECSIGGEGFTKNCRHSSLFLVEEPAPVAFRLKIPRKYENIGHFDFRIQYVYYDEEFDENVGPYIVSNCKNCSVRKTHTDRGLDVWLLECE